LRAGKLLVHPALRNYLLRTPLAETTGKFRAILQEHKSDLFVLSSRKFYFLSRTLAGDATCVIDFCDSQSLYFFRQAKHSFTGREWRKALYSIRRMSGEALIERYYSRSAALSVVVSPVDREVLNRINGSPQKNIVVLNGVTGPKPGAASEKVPDQIIFSGNMDFPPNYQSAIWLIDRIFPLVLERVPGATLVIAGANPVAELKSRENATIKIAGFVEDLPGLIAASRLYVAPMVSGGGFKNKVVEAISSGTYVVATPVGVEFLSPELRSLLSVASTPEDLADSIVSALRDPVATEARVEQLRETIGREFSWSRSAENLLSVLRRAAATRTHLPRTQSP
jgi:glycosyltransferase involved in cell wall biosynthesis